MAVIEKLLKQIGLPQSTIKEVLAAEAENTDFDVSAVVTSFKESQRTLYEDDADLAETFKAQERGKLLDIWTNKIKKDFGLSSEQVKGLKMDEVIALAKGESVKSVSKDIQQLQEENLTLSNKLKEYDEVVIPGVKSEVEREKKSFKIQNYVQTLIPPDVLIDLWESPSREWFKPIPLTEDILLRLPKLLAIFEGSEYEIFYNFEDKQLYHDSNFALCNLVSCKKIEYLHNLQNFMKEYSGQELTLNP